MESQIIPEGAKIQQIPETFTDVSGRTIKVIERGKKCYICQAMFAPEKRNPTVKLKYRVMEKILSHTWQGFQENLTNLQYYESFETLPEARKAFKEFEADLSKPVKFI